MSTSTGQRVVLCTAGSGPHATYVDLVRPMLDHYADRYGYDVVAYHRALQTSRPPAWDKILLLRTLLDSYDTAVWIDADAAIVRYDQDICDVADHTKQFWLTKHHYNSADQPNTGVLVLHRSPDVMRFLEQVWGQTSVIHHPWWEQAAILRLLGYDVSRLGEAHLTAPTPWFDMVGWLPKEWNSIIEDPAEAPRIVHLAGQPADVRIAQLSAHRRSFEARRSGEVRLEQMPAEGVPTRNELPDRRHVTTILPLSPADSVETALASLVSIANQDHEVNLVITDNGARLRSVLAAVSGPVVPIWNESRSSLASVWDRALSTTSDEIVVLMTRPVELAPSCLRSLLASLDAEDVAGTTTTAANNAMSSPLRAHVLACRRADLVATGGVPLASSDDDLLADVCLQLARTGRRIVASIVACEHELTSRFGTPQIPLRAPHYIIEMCRQGYPSALAQAVQLPTREELPELLEARGLRGIGVEVGVQHGLFSHHLLSHWTGTLVSVDPWMHCDTYADVANVESVDQEEIYRSACKRLAIFGSRSQIWRQTSLEAARELADGTLDFVYLDARHDHESVAEDLAAWWPKVHPGGIIAGHDYLDGDLPEGRFGVRRAVTEFFGSLGIEVRSTFLDPPWFSWVVVAPLAPEPETRVAAELQSGVPDARTSA